MIFVTVGTHEQPFNRLVEYVDRAKREGMIEEDVIIQTGYSTYEPGSCKWKNIYPYEEMVRLVKEARIVISHGGPSSFVMALQEGKIPIVVPRRHDFNEHVNDHQAAFSHAVSERMGSIIVVDEVDDLLDVIDRYDVIVRGMNREMSSNNARFNENLRRIVETMFAKNVEND